MRYYDKMLEVAEKQTAHGVIILMPYVAIAPEFQDDVIKAMLDEMHRAKIDMSDGIIVVGKHIGESTTKEIAYARQRGIEVIDWLPIP